jgi:hypothetical protein
MWINILSKWITDEKWNKLVMRTDWKIILRLTSWEIRNIWKVKKDKNGYYLYTIRDWEHYMEKIQGRWFNYELIKALPEDMRIVVRYWSLKYVMTAWMILKWWKFLYFLQQGFEKQLFIEKSMFWLY